jgi:hypothetical protein
MGYLHINNLYRDQRIMLFRECFALEKVHGTSAHVGYSVGGGLRFFSGGEKHDRFVALFDAAALTERFVTLSHDDDVVVYGEAYGGKQQGMSATYGPELAFIAFDVKIGDTWLAVPQAKDVCDKLGIEFVPVAYGPTTLEFLDAQRDADSEVAIRRGMGPGHRREGVVLRPPVEVSMNNGERIIAKHKRDEFRETKSPRVVDDPMKLAVLSEADAIATEWVTEMRLVHVLQRIPEPHDMAQIPQVIAAMIEDVTREGAGEIVDSKAARKAIGARTAALFKARLQARMRGAA